VKHVVLVSDYPNECTKRLCQLVHYRSY